MSDERRATETGVAKTTEWRRWVSMVAAVAGLVVIVVAGGCQKAQTASGPTTDPQRSAVSTVPGLEPTTTPQRSAPATDALPGKAMPLMKSRRHIAPGPTHEPYNTDPPTSGPHYSIPAKAGFYTDALPDEQLVHNLEHGYVVIWYNADDLTPDERALLVADIGGAMKVAGNSPSTGTPKLIAVPRPTLKYRLALSTWGRLDVLPRFDQQEILRFIAAFRDKSPEGSEP